MRAMGEGTVKNVAGAISAMRAAIGVGALLAPGLASRLIRFPADHDNASARAMTRLFGAREIGVGLLTLRGLDDRERLPGVLAVNATMDSLDAMVFATAIARREGIDKAAIPSMLLALPVALTWLRLLRAVG
jgi:hypothetical protein